MGFWEKLLNEMGYVRKPRPEDEPEQPWIGNTMTSREADRHIERKAAALYDGTAERALGAEQFALVSDGATHSFRHQGRWRREYGDFWPEIDSEQIEPFQAYLNYLFDGLPLDTPQLQSTFVRFDSKEACIVNMACSALESAYLAAQNAGRVR